MADREDNVYKAKLTEQAERYDGKHLTLCSNSALERAAGVSHKGAARI